MEPSQNSRLLERGVIPPGAIFMSNRETKEESLRRHLFGLPSSHATLVQKIKVGMILFLFEYEERRLYGVFEATSDGSMDIIPMAFVRSGKAFSAQVRFQTIWQCDPLTEEEFHDAVAENYYGARKFHFGLSRTQVYKLLRLFDSKRIETQWIYGGVSKFSLDSTFSEVTDDIKRHEVIMREYECRDKSSARLCADHYPLHHQRPSPPSFYSCISDVEVPDLCQDRSHPSSRADLRPQLPNSPHLQAATAYPSGSIQSCCYPLYHPDHGYPSMIDISENTGIHRSIPHEPYYPANVSSRSLLPSSISPNDRTLHPASSYYLSTRGSPSEPSSPQEFNNLGNSDALLLNPLGAYVDVFKDASPPHCPVRPKLALLVNGSAAEPGYSTLWLRNVQDGLELPESTCHVSRESQRKMTRTPYEDSRSLQLNEVGEFYPAPARIKYCVENQEERTSVFSRLSGPQRNAVIFREREMYVERSARKRMTYFSDFREPKRGFDALRNGYGFRAALDDEESLECSTSVAEEKKSDVGQPAVSFKRRSEAKRATDHRGTNSSMQETEGEATSAKPKRKKLRRPSLAEEDDQKLTTPTQQSSPVEGNADGKPNK